MLSYNGSTALVVVDMQNDFAHPKGSLYVRGGEGILGRVNAEIARALAGGAAVAYSQDWHPQETTHFQTQGGIWPVHCVGETWGAAFVDGLALAEGALHVRKGTGGEDGYSSFSVRHPESGVRWATELEAFLKQREIREVVIMGLATDYCVKETALDALRLGFSVAVLGEAVRAVNLAVGDGERALAEVVAAGGRVMGG